jgi:cation:H+ antiporter
MTLSLFLIVVGFISLYYGAEWLVGGAIRLALHFKISKVVVGLVLVAFGTSSPELFVNLIAALDGRTGFALSNVSGSNLTNLCIGFGLCTLFGILFVDKKKFGIDLIYFGGAPLLVFIFMLLTPGLSLPLWSVIPFIILFIFYLALIRSRVRDEEILEESSRGNLVRGIFWFLLGCVALYSGGELVVRNAVNLGVYLGISETILGLTIVAFGTSIPDVMASITAVRRGETDIAVGNLLGSNIFNVLLILTGTLIFSGANLNADKNIVMDYAVVTLSSLLFIILITFSARVSRLSGGILILIYMAYITYRVLLVINV